MSEFDLRQEILFPEEILVAYANRLLDEVGSRLQVLGAAQTQYDRVVLFSMTREGRNVRLVAPVCEFMTGVISFRSILQAQPGAVWGLDGRASAGCKEIAFYADEGPKLAASRDALAEYMRSSKPEPHQHVASHFENVERALAERLASGSYGEEFETVTDDARRPLQPQAVPLLAMAV